jgi:hypothetical protein
MYTSQQGVYLRNAVNGDISAFEYSKFFQLTLDTQINFSKAFNAYPFLNFQTEDRIIKSLIGD